MKLTNKSTKYRNAIEFIAANDEPNIMNWTELTDLISTVLVSHIFKVDQKDVAKDIITVRLYWKVQE